MDAKLIGAIRDLEWKKDEKKSEKPKNQKREKNHPSLMRIQLVDRFLF